MLFWKKKMPPLVQSSASAWREQWRAIVPPECRNVPVTVGDKTFTPDGCGHGIANTGDEDLVFMALIQLD